MPENHAIFIGTNFKWDSFYPLEVCSEYTRTQFWSVLGLHLFLWNFIIFIGTVKTFASAFFVIRWKNARVIPPYDIWKFQEIWTGSSCLYVCCGPSESSFTFELNCLLLTFWKYLYTVFGTSHHFLSCLYFILPPGVLCV